MTTTMIECLAFLLGSDYTEGLPGVGPVLAMELLKEFPGEDGLHQFKEWWRKVQSGRDSAQDTASAFRKRFKKRFGTLHLTEDWPHAAVRDAYYHPTVDRSEEPFKWGLPDLDGLRRFLNAELSWPTQKVDDTLLPIIRKVGLRGKSGNVGRQSTMDLFFDVLRGSGTFAPRQRAAFASKRLQKVVADFRKEKKAQGNLIPGDPTSAAGSDDSDSTSSDEGSLAGLSKQTDTARPKPKARTPRAKPTPSAEQADGEAPSRSKPSKRKAPTKSKPQTKKKRKTQADDDSGDEETDPALETNHGGADSIPDRPLSVSLRPRARPRPKRPVPNSNNVAIEGDEQVANE